MMKVFTLVLGLLLLGASSLEAQGFLPFTRRPVNKEQYARACEMNDMSVLNVNCDRIVAAFNATFNHVNLANRQEFADYFRGLTQSECPSLTTDLARVARTTRLIDLEGRARPFRRGEQCFFDSNEGIWIASAMCGNIITGDQPPVERAQVAEVLPPDDARSRLRQSIATAGSNTPLLTPVPVERHSWFSFQRNGKWFWPVVGAAAIGTGCILSEYHCTNYNVNRTRIHVGR